MPVRAVQFSVWPRFVGPYGRERQPTGRADVRRGRTESNRQRSIESQQPGSLAQTIAAKQDVDVGMRPRYGDRLFHIYLQRITEGFEAFRRPDAGRRQAANFSRDMIEILRVQIPRIEVTAVARHASGMRQTLQQPRPFPCQELLGRPG